MVRPVRAILVALVVLATAFASSFAVSSGTHSASAQKVTYLPNGRTIHQLRMEVIVKTSNSDYWQLVFGAARHAAQQFGVRSLGYVGGPSEADLNADQIAKVMPVINTDPRIPANITFYADPAHLDRELASNMPDKNATNGTGIDHSDDYSTPILQAIFEDVAKALGAPA